MRLLVVMPARNELTNLPEVIAELRLLRPDLDLLVIDDGSNDSTVSWLQQAGIRYLRLAFPLGVGDAVRTGLRYAVENGFTHALRMDADGQHPPQEIAKILEPVLDGHCDAACGSRFLLDGSETAPTFRRIAQGSLGWSLSQLTRQRITDPTSGFWFFGPRALGLLADHHPSGYPEPELHLLLHRNGLAVTEVPVTMRRRKTGRSSLTPGRAALALARAMLAMIVVPLRAVTEGGSGD